MSVKRLIRFKPEALFDPLTYQALIADKVGTWKRLTTGEIEVLDELDADFPALRAHFLVHGYSSDFYGQRAIDGDHQQWRHTRNGQELMTNAGLVLDDGSPPLTQLRDQKK